MPQNKHNCWSWVIGLLYTILFTSVYNFPSIVHYIYVTFFLKMPCSLAWHIQKRGRLGPSMIWPQPISRTMSPDVPHPVYRFLHTSAVFFHCCAFPYVIFPLLNAFPTFLSLFNSHSAFKTDVQCQLLQELHWIYNPATVIPLGPHASLSFTTYFEILNHPFTGLSLPTVSVWGPDTL